jgi:hypothetical protein
MDSVSSNKRIVGMWPMSPRAVTLPAAPDQPGVVTVQPKFSPKDTALPLLGEPYVLQLFRVILGTNPRTMRIPTQAFSIERRVGVAFSEGNIYPQHGFTQVYMSI